MTLLTELKKIVHIADGDSATVVPNTQHLVIARVCRGRRNSPVGVIEHSDHQQDHGKIILDRFSMLENSLQHLVLMSVFSDKKKSAVGEVCHVSCRLNHGLFEPIRQVPIKYPLSATEDTIVEDHTQLLKRTFYQYSRAKKYGFQAVPSADFNAQQYRANIEALYEIDDMTIPIGTDAQRKSLVTIRRKDHCRLELSDWLILQEHLSLDANVIPTAVPGGHDRFCLIHA